MRKPQDFTVTKTFSQDSFMQKIKLIDYSDGFKRNR